MIYGVALVVLFAVGGGMFLMVLRLAMDEIERGRDRAGKEGREKGGDGD